MDLQTVKFGLAMAVCGLIGVVLFFALYLRLAQPAGRKNQGRD